MDWRICFYHGGILGYAEDIHSQALEFCAFWVHLLVSNGEVRQAVLAT